MRKVGWFSMGNNRPHSHSGCGSMRSGENMPVRSDEGHSALTPIFRDDERVTRYCWLEYGLFWAKGTTPDSPFSSHNQQY